MSMATYLNLRSEYEDIVHDFKLPAEVKTGLKESFEWFYKSLFGDMKKVPTKMLC